MAAAAARDELHERIPLVRWALDAVGELARRAFTHPLTGLLNRAAYLVRAEELDRDPSARPAVVFMDLTGFKATNDRHGHAAGDACLVVAGERLVEAAATVGGTAFHVGGDEFLVLLDAARVGDLRAVVLATLASFSVPWRGRPLAGRATAGVADGARLVTVEDLRERAERACSAAKAAGRPWAAWTEGLTVDAQERRWRCQECGSTTSVVVGAAREGDPARCPICEVRL